MGLKHNIIPTSLDIIRNYFLTEELLIFKYNKCNSPRHFECKVIRAIEKARKLPEKVLLKYSLDEYHPRYDNYYNSSWAWETISLKDCGCWPKMGGLPYSYTKGTLEDTAIKLQKLIENKNLLSLSTLEALYIEELMPAASIINRHVPIIIMEDSVIRSHKLSCKNKIYDKTLYDIEDGNHRAVCHYLNGAHRINAFVGKKLYKNPILYTSK